MKTNNIECNHKIYIVLSHNHTFFGNLVCFKEKLNFGRDDLGAKYSHASLSLDKDLHHMLSFARKKVHNPFIAGLVMEDISSGVFALKPNRNYMAVICLDVSEQSYNKLSLRMNEYWNRKDYYKYDAHTLFRGIFRGRDRKQNDNKNAFCCSIWVENILRECDIDIFKDETLYLISPADLYHKLKDFIIYEGLTKEYLRNARTKNTSYIL